MGFSPDLPVGRRRVAIAVRGVVQGVGFRPFVYNAAMARGLAGWVQNEVDTVRIEVEGDSADVDQFVHVLHHGPPPQARIDSLDVAEVPCQNGTAGVFEIRTSPAEGVPRPTIPADLATCPECAQEIRGPGERRYRYPFTNCTNCGPRWSIIERLPYDRPRTSMALFRMCPACKAEYDNPADRRFHAQPIACPDCGPILELLDHDGSRITLADEALDSSVAAIRAGQILALKGLGGFQLLVDATNARAVERLRHRKHRVEKPFAVMFPSLDEVRRRCEVSDEEARLLLSPQSPIVLLRQLGPGAGLDDVATAVAPGNPYLGVMLPYTPLHHLLLATLRRPIVCTSGNLSEEPMAITPEDAVERLGAIADALLIHDRPIVRPVDDSVARVGPDGPQVLRRARGYAPLPINLGFAAPTLLAVGGHLKNTVALSIGSQVVLSPHIGDLDSVLSVDVHQRAIADLVHFFSVAPEAVVCDLHPDYASTRHAEALASGWSVPLVRVQHHHAHVAACMAEHRIEGPVLGFSWDGTGYGPDGTIWGGEVLECEGAGYRRVAHLRTFALPGGDRAIREPRRSAFGVLYEVFGDEAGACAEELGLTASEGRERSESHLLLSLLKRSVQSPRTSSMGRLFDAVAALCGLPAAITFEGQAAMALEFAAEEEHEDAYPLPVSDGTPAIIDWEPLVRAAASDRMAGAPRGRISARFHNALAGMTVAVAQRWGGRRVVLSGGCFQNALLARRVRQRLLDAGCEVYTHHQVPPGDGGIALGQIAVAARIQR